MSFSGKREIDERSVISRDTEIVFSRLDDDLLAMDERAGYCYSLNVSAARVWDLLLSPASVGWVCSVLCSEFQIDRDTCLRDISELLYAMLDARLIRVLNHAAKA
jgi:hypothetical protein